MKREIDSRAADELSAWPGVQSRTVQTKRHVRIELEYQGKKGLVVRSSTPSDRRAVLNHIGDLRRTCARLGACRKGK